MQATPPRSQPSADVVVLGGGISGLTAAWHLARAGIDVRLLEAGRSVGGCTQTETRDGFLLEKGPFNVIVRDPAFEDLLSDLSGEIDVITAAQSARLRYVFRGGRLLPVPTNPVALATTGLLSFPARCRLLAGLLLSKRAPKAEETIEQAAVRRFGRETADVIVSAAIAGIFAGDSSVLSLSACFPSVARIDAETRSLIAYRLSASFRRRKGKRRRRWKGLVSIGGGLGAVTAALGKTLGDDLHTGCAAVAIRATSHGYEVEYRDQNHASRMIWCSRLVIALPAAQTSGLLAPLLPDATALLETIESASVVVLNLGFRTGDVAHPMQGFGFLVPRSESALGLMGVLWSDSVFPHHAPPGHRLIRVFLGGRPTRLNPYRSEAGPEPSEGPGIRARTLNTCRPPSAVATNSATGRTPPAATIDVEQTEDALLFTTMTALQPVLGISGQPVLVDVCRHPGAIPQYRLGHRQVIDRLRTLVATKPGLHLIGNYLDGVSLNDCVRLATTVAHRLIKNGTSEPPTAQRHANGCDEPQAASSLR